jgi:hypothetical protein
MNRKPYPSAISEDEWAFVAPYLTLMTAGASQRVHDLREVLMGCDGLCAQESPGG